jgi:hypothetical protein
MEDVLQYQTFSTTLVALNEEVYDMVSTTKFVVLNGHNTCTILPAESRCGSAQRESDPD